MTLDTHQHFWQYDPVRHEWIDDAMAAIRRDFMPADLKPLLETEGIEGCVAVQVDQAEYENGFLLDLAKQHDFIKAVVGWIDLRSPYLEQHLEQYAGESKLVGFRHIVQGESDHNFLLRGDFVQGVRTLGQHEYTYDVLIFPHQLGAVLEFVRHLPDQKLVIDHIAKPYVKDGFFDGWAVLMQEIAKAPNVHCKISGMITEADWQNWERDHFKRYLDVVFGAFGPERVMYGSDWPVCLLAGTYHQVIDLVRWYTEGYSESEKAGLFGLNGASFYGIK